MTDQVELKRIWHYDLLTGRFTRLVKTRGRGKVGDVANHHNKDGYIVIGFKAKKYFGHRLAFMYVTGSFPKHKTDHINGIPNDNRWCNLRDVPQAINNQNHRSKRKDNTSGHVGVSWNKLANKWQAQIQANGEYLYLGLFDDVHEAGAYRLQKKRELHEGCTI